MISKRVWSERLTRLQIMAKGRQLKRWLSLAREVAGTALQSAPQLLNATLTALKARWHADIERLQLALELMQACRLVNTPQARLQASFYTTANAVGLVNDDSK